MPDAAQEDGGREDAIAARGGARSRRYLGALALAALAAVIGALALHRSGESAVLAPGTPLPPFAVPLVTGELTGDANYATGPNEGAAGSRPACSVRGAGILNLCELYEGRPVVLALVVPSACQPTLLRELQALATSFPEVAFAAVAIRPDRSSLRRLIAAEHLTIPIGIDRDGALVPLYRVLTCEQIDFAYPGGALQSKALLTRPPPATLRARVRELVAAARARGWRRPTGGRSAG